MGNQNIKVMTKTRKLFTMKLTEEERKQYDELAETHGFCTLAGLIRACLYAAVHDPTILNPTINPELKGINRTEYELLSAFNRSTETLQSLVERATEEIEKNRRLSEGILK
jgi:hypothetical protein